MEILLIWLVFAVATAAVAGSKGRSVIGWFLLGVLFSLIALIVVACLPSLTASSAAGFLSTPSPSTHIICPDCRSYIPKEARVCRYCGCRLVPQP